MLERLEARKANYFAVMDFTQGFHQIAMDKASAVLTTFIVSAKFTSMIASFTKLIKRNS